MRSRLLRRKVLAPAQSRNILPPHLSLMRTVRSDSQHVTVAPCSAVAPRGRPRGGRRRQQTDAAAALAGAVLVQPAPPKKQQRASAEDGRCPLVARTPTGTAARFFCCLPGW